MESKISTSYIQLYSISYKYTIQQITVVARLICSKVSNNKNFMSYTTTKINSPFNIF